ncbi:MAG: hypothetical protein ACYC1D_07380 [Acidimicrobiales bacterium]
MIAGCDGLDSAGDAMSFSELGDAVFGERETASGAAPLAVEDRRDGDVVVVGGETAYELDGVDVGGPPRGAHAGQGRLHVAGGAAFPVQDEVGVALRALDRQGDLAQQGPQELLAFPRRRGRRLEDRFQVRSGLGEPVELLGAQRRRPAGSLSGQRGRGVSGGAETLFPFDLEVAGHEPVLRFARLI